MHCNTGDNGEVRAAEQWRSSGDSVQFFICVYLLIVAAIFVDLLKYHWHFATNL